MVALAYLLFAVITFITARLAIESDLPESLVGYAITAMLIVAMLERIPALVAGEIR